MGRASSGLSKSIKVSDAAKNLTINGATIESLVAPFLKKYKYVGLRTQDEPFEMGEMSHVSSVWVNGIETKKKLKGVSVTDVKNDAVYAHSDLKEDTETQKKYGKIGYYYGDYVAIVAGNKKRKGKDKGEMVLQDAVVVKILK